MKSFVKIRFVLALLLFMHVMGVVAFAPNLHVAKHRLQTAVQSSFYEDFENFEADDEDDEDDDDDDDEDNDYEDVDDAAVADFRSKIGSLSSVDELISLAALRATEEASTEWARPVDKIEAGVVLVANPAKFCSDFDGRSSPSTSLLSKFGLTLPPPADLGPDRRADLLPVLLLLERHALRGSQAVLLNRRTGYLLGDLEQQQTEDGLSSPGPPKLGAFMIQPLWFGGTSSGSDETSSSGLDMVHLCPAVEGAKQLTTDGLYWGGDPSQAQEAMCDPSLDRVMNGFDFKFFVQSTRWLPLQVY